MSTGPGDDGAGPSSADPPASEPTAAALSEDAAEEAEASSGGDGEEDGEGESDGDGDEDEDGDEEEDEEDEEEESEEEDLGPREMPNRTTRGRRLGQALEDEEADSEFWGQDFFAEEEREADWEKSGSEATDVPDSDFDMSEEEEDEAETEEPKEQKKKTMRPPGHKAPGTQPPGARAKAAGPKKAAPPKPPSSGGKVKGKASARELGADGKFESPKLRASTRARVDEAAEYREMRDQVKPKKKKPAKVAVEKPITQDEMLLEAAFTEIHNTRSLAKLLAREEAAKARSAQVEGRYEGPTVRSRSKRNGEFAQTALELVNLTELPEELRARTAPAPPARAVCVLTGQPAAYRHPRTREPYATIEAYKTLQRRYEEAQAAQVAAAEQRALLTQRQAAALGASGVPLAPRSKRSISGTAYPGYDAAHSQPLPQQQPSAGLANGYRHAPEGQHQQPRQQQNQQQRHQQPQPQLPQQQQQPQQWPQQPKQQPQQQQWVQQQRLSEQQGHVPQRPSQQRGPGHQWPPQQASQPPQQAQAPQHHSYQQPQQPAPAQHQAHSQPASGNAQVQPAAGYYQLQYQQPQSNGGYQQAPYQQQQQQWQPQQMLHQQLPPQQMQYQQLPPQPLQQQHLQQQQQLQQQRQQMPHGYQQHPQQAQQHLYAQQQHMPQQPQRQQQHFYQQPMQQDGQGSISGAPTVRPAALGLNRTHGQ